MVVEWLSGKNYLKRKEQKCVRLGGGIMPTTEPVAPYSSRVSAWWRQNKKTLIHPIHIGWSVPTTSDQTGIRVVDGAAAEVAGIGGGNGKGYNSEVADGPDWNLLHVETPSRQLPRKIRGVAQVIL